MKEIKTPAISSVPKTPSDLVRPDETSRRYRKYTKKRWPTMLNINTSEGVRNSNARRLHILTQSSTRMSTQAIRCIETLPQSGATEAASRGVEGEEGLGYKKMPCKMTMGRNATSLRASLMVCHNSTEFRSTFPCSQQSHNRTEPDGEPSKLARGHAGGKTQGTYHEERRHHENEREKYQVHRSGPRSVRCTDRTAPFERARPSTAQRGYRGGMAGSGRERQHTSEHIIRRVPTDGDGEKLRQNNPNHVAHNVLGRAARRVP